MTTRSMIRRAERYLEYRVQWLGLSLGGPARLDDAHDPLERLRRHYHRPAARPRRTHLTRGGESLRRLPD
jgi:hypothetical protein